MSAGPEPGRRALRVPTLRPAALRAIAAGALGCVLLAASGGGGAGREPTDTAVAGAEGSGIELLVATDLHYLSPKLHDGGPAFLRFSRSGDGKEIARSPALLAALERQVLGARPTALLVTGDLTVNGERRSHEELAAAFARIERGGVQVLAIPGNHDLGEERARAFRGELQLRTPGTGPADFARIHAEFGYREAESRDAGSLSYLARPAPGLSLLMLDSCLYAGKEGADRSLTRGRLSAATLAWAGKALAAARARGDLVVAAMHHSLVDHSEVIARGYTLDNAAELGALLASGGVSLLLSGHVHVQDIAAADFGSPPLRIHDVATNALSVYPNRLGRIRVGGDGRLSYSTEELEVEAWAAEAGSADPHLRGFEAASAEAFTEAARRMAREVLGGGAGGAEDPDAAAGPAGASDSAAEAMALLNVRYFAGEEWRNEADLFGSLGLEALLASPRGFLADYARSILRDPEFDDNRLELRFGD